MFHRSDFKKQDIVSYGRFIACEVTKTYPGWDLEIKTPSRTRIRVDSRECTRYEDPKNGV